MPLLPTRETPGAISRCMQQPLFQPPGHPPCPCHSCPSSPMNDIRRIASNQIYSASAGVQCYFHPVIGTNKLHPICVSHQSSLLLEFSPRVSDVSLRMLAKLFIFDSNWAGITMLFYSQLQSFHLRLFMDSVVVLWIQIKQAPRQVSQQASKRMRAYLMKRSTENRRPIRSFGEIPEFR